MTTKKDTEQTSSPSRIPTWLIILVPLALLALLILLFIRSDPVEISTANLPPVENVVIERIDVTETGFEIHVLNAGPDPVEIAQLLVDEAYWQFTIQPGHRLERLQTAVLHVNYPWVEAEPNEIVLLTSTGATFASEVELAVETPTPGGDQLMGYALVGFYVGIIPIGLGLLWYPAMRRVGRRGMDFLLSLTIGLLVFLLVDTLLESFEVAALLPEVYQGVPLSLFAALITWLAITAIGSRKGTADRDSLSGRKFIALLIAIGIGFHNLGEGLVVGAAFAIGEAALGSFLVIGFILHNITEGIGIAAPVTRDRPSLGWFLGLLLIAGSPAILGTLVGGFAYSPLLAVVFLGVGTGAIWQVIFEVGGLMQRAAKRTASSLVNWTNTAGLLLGIAIMYLTAFLVKF
jgi:ZIP family zinc transporter